MSAPEPQDEVQEFAALLRRLKERTDRSYGSLARRINMNTSTLHRYCAGEAVPLDFAPVERFAALCGASAEERLELHRLWLPAVAARQRPRAGEGAGASAGAAGTAAGVGAGAGAGAVTEAGAGGPAETAPADDRDRDTPADGDGDADGNDDDDTDALVSGPGLPPHRPWYRRRRVAVAAAAAVALLATVGSLAALPSGRSASDKVAQAPDPSSGTTASGTPGRTPSESPSLSATSGSPSPKGTGKSASPSAPDGSTASKGTGDSGQQGTFTGTPLTWTVNSHIWNAGCGHDYVIDKPPAQVPPPPMSQDAANWAGPLGAIHGRETMVQISVQGKNSTAVVLEDLRVRVVSRGAPAKGNAYAMEQGCGGALTPRYFSVNLDKDRPIAHPESGNDGENVLPAVKMPYRVSSEDPEILLVTAQTQTCDCSWYLELDWSSQGRTGTVRVDDGGKPFRTTSIKGLPRYWYGTDGAGQRAWVDYDG
ncbi:helix-turn-helix transcriptional regulator [Streptomyces sp. SID13726]|uniref:helix-turn-helix domain-containing protein n=1 Tax=Streptomyces sp. SID13726 TaxID=2706058 RepID=UPI0013B98E74|nr:helix-turn-helix transcriptional regulator [Streptomyces sp. SID13726]NEA98006.1 helix-turn-helix domain-containing protein [Streptomyces sp. SID13726]